MLQARRRYSVWSGIPWVVQEKSKVSVLESWQEAAIHTKAPNTTAYNPQNVDNAKRCKSLGGLCYSLYGVSWIPGDLDANA
jgi:hypothetical protein